MGLDKVKYVDVVLEHNGQKIEVNNVKLLRTRHTASRQFTIPKDVREKYGIRPFDDVTVHMIIPRQVHLHQRIKLMNKFKTEQHLKISNTQSGH